MVINRNFKIIQLVLGTLLLSLVYSCPGEEDCFDLASVSRVDNLVILTPEQEVYNQGDEVTLKMFLPAVNDYFDENINLFELTNDELVTIVMRDSDLYQENDLVFVSGNQGEFINWFEIPYNPETENYELEIVIVLNRVGEYSIRTDESIVFQGSDNCNRFRLDTNIAWSTFGIVEFTVIE